MNNRQFTPVRACATRCSKRRRARSPIELLVKNGEYYSVHRVEYQGGEKYPHLERDESKPDVLTKIIEPLVKR